MSVIVSQNHYINNKISDVHPLTMWCKLAHDSSDSSVSGPLMVLETYGINAVANKGHTSIA